MDAFNQGYKRWVDGAPFFVLSTRCDPHEVDRTFWKIKELEGGIQGRGSHEWTTYKALFSGPKYAASIGHYECVLTKIINRGDQPSIMPGLPRWHDYALPPAIDPFLDVSRAHRSWSEAAGGRPVNAGRVLGGGFK